MIRRTRFLNILSIIIGAVLSYTLSQIGDSTYNKIEQLINYKWLLICSLILILILTYLLLSNPNFKNKSKLKKNSDVDLIQSKDILPEQKYILENLAADEKVILKSYFDENVSSLQFSIQDGVVMGLKNKMVLNMPTKFARGKSMMISFNMQPWAKEYLMKHPELLS